MERELAHAGREVIVSQLIDLTLNLEGLTALCR
jgi:hypothetical protein